MGVFCHWEQLVVHMLKITEHSSELPLIPAASLTSSLAHGSLRWDSSCFNVLHAWFSSSAQLKLFFHAQPPPSALALPLHFSRNAIHMWTVLFSPSPAHLSNHTQLLVIWPKKAAPDNTSFSQCEGEYASPTYLSQK